MNYDKAYVERYRKFAITDVESFQVGKTYYSNDLIGRFVLKRLITNADHYKEVGLVWGLADGDKLGWFEASSQRKNGDRRYKDIYSLRDFNVGTSYNPWLIFADKETMEEYKKGLKVSYPRSYDWDYD